VTNQPHVGVDAQRAILALQIVPYQEVDDAPARQVLMGMKFFVMKISRSLERTSGFGHPMTLRNQVQTSSLLDMRIHGQL
jgi:hypothetical protein